MSMKVIATHVNADFDGFAAMVGLLKLHPDARLVFPGSKESGVRQFMRFSGAEFPEISVRELKDVTHLFLVDVSRDDRLGPLAPFLKQNPRPYIEIYDHHPENQANIPADAVHSLQCGATTTIVVLKLMEQKISLPSLEASLLLAGIHEDTAGFLSTSTSSLDFQAALYLLGQNAEISVVNRMLTHRLQPEQISFFNTMVSHCEQLNVEGSLIVLSAFSWPVFLPEVAYLVHRLMDLEPIDVFFAMILMEERVHIIGRSAVPDVDVGQILSLIGGGGHKMAASAVWKGVTLIEAREKLMEILHQNLRFRKRAADLMKTNIISIKSKKRISDAAALLNKHRINALPVVEKANVVGTISRQIVDGAVFHGLQDRLVEEFMITDLPLVDPETPLPEIFEQMVSGRNRFVLVGKDSAHVEGIITRMDLLRHQYEFSSETVKLRKGRKSENLEAMLNKRLPERVFQLLKECGRIADEIGTRVYLVGGMVRDILLHRENMDIDLVIEGDGIQFAKAFANRNGCELAAHDRFGTATIVFPDRFKMDVASARTESYQSPAALPEVQGGILRQDLYRRDFTINSLAVDLSPQNFGNLIDYFGGWDDLHRGVIRILHGLSFIDDPTRALRAVRFATRFNFRISEDTKRFMRNAAEIKVLDKLSGKRFWSELRNLLMEEHPIPGIRMLSEYGLLSFIHPQVELDPFTLDLLYQIESVLSWFHLNFLNERPGKWLLQLMALLEKLNRDERIAVAQKFQLTADAQEILRVYKSNAKDIHTRLRDVQKASSLYFSLREYPVEVLLYAMARAGQDSMRQRIALYLRDLRGSKLQISGDDVMKLGVPQGPKVKEALDQVLRVHLDGGAPDRERQLEAASQIVPTL
jgi:tRNA nucleotidyltransferase (CCA-adding enzyme)